MPIFESDKPSSCVQCHLASVDLKNYILPSHEKTFVSLRDQGMINLDKPQDSKILHLINMSPSDTKGANLIHEKMREAEYQAFAQWITASAQDPKLRNAPPLKKGKLARPPVSDKVIRHGRVEGVLDSFTRNIWALRFRCAGCHMPGGVKFEKHTAKHGKIMGWLKKEGPYASMKYIIANGLIDIDKPEKSKLLLKPLDILDHGGGIKMLEGDTDYMAFLNWIRDYANIVNGKYTSEEQLPQRTRLTGSEIWLRIQGVPAHWVKKTGFITVHGRADSGKWSEQPLAITSFMGRNGPRFGNFAQGYLMINSKQADKPRLRPGRYLIKVYLDSKPRTTTDFTKALAGSKFNSSAVITAQWDTGWKGATSFKASQLNR